MEVWSLNVKAVPESVMTKTKPQQNRWRKGGKERETERRGKGKEGKHPNYHSPYHHKDWQTVNSSMINSMQGRQQM